MKWISSRSFIMTDVIVIINIVDGHDCNGEEQKGAT